MENLLELKKILSSTEMSSFCWELVNNVSLPKVKKIINRIYLTAREMYIITKEQKIKHKYKYRGIEPIEYINSDPVLSLNYHFYKIALKKADKDYLLIKYNIHNAIYDYKILNEVTGYCFVKGVKDYQYLVGLTTLYGWKKYSGTNNDIIEKIKSWVSNKFQPNYNGSTEKYYEVFRRKVREILRWKDGTQPFEISPEEFVTNVAETGTAGGAYDPRGPKATVEIEGINYKLRNNKYSKSIALSTKQKLIRIFKKERQQSNVSIKMEFYPKVRLIASADFNTTMKMRYIALWMDKWMAGNPLSTLWHTKAQTFEMWRSMAEITAPEVFVPVDQTNFDFSITAEMIKIMNEEDKNLMIEKGYDLPGKQIKEDALKIQDCITFATAGGLVIYDVADFKIDYSSGLISGYQLTARYGTTANAAQMQTAIELAQTEKGLIRGFFQGDDISSTFKNIVDALLTITAFRATGFNIHPNKSFYSQRHNEFLRKYYVDGEINGYAARMVNGLLWVYPGEDLTYTLIEKLSSTVDKWVKFGERLHLNPRDVVHYIRKDYSGMGIDRHIAKTYLKTSRYNGGAGLTGNDMNTNIEVKPSEYRGYANFANDPGYVDFTKTFGLYQTNEMQQWVTKVTEAQKMLDEISPMEVFTKPTEPLLPLEFQLYPARTIQTPKLRTGYTNKVIFGRTQEFMGYVFPEIDPFIQASRAPKSWIYSYLTGSLDEVSPRVQGMSQEMSSLAFDAYRPSLIQAMYYKKNVPDKWKRLQLYAGLNFGSEIRATMKLPKLMF